MDRLRTVVTSAPAGRTSLRLLEHREDILGEPHGFGTLPFDTHGSLVAAGTRTSLWTTALEHGGWTSWRRDLDLADLSHGPAQRVLEPAGDDLMAVVHHVIVLDDGRSLALYSNGCGLRGALAAAPEAPLERLAGFRLDPSEPWELLGRRPTECSLEANGAYARIEETDDALEFWEGYDSYHPGEKRGDLGWVRLRFDKRAGTLAAVGRHPANPLPFRPAGWACARCGGNLASDIRVDGRGLFPYYLRPDPEHVVLAAVAGDDPLFLDAGDPFDFDVLAGHEALAEKFEKVEVGGDLLVFYESRHDDGSWHTGVRRYAAELSRFPGRDAPAAAARDRGGLTTFAPSSRRS
jgi:hypothetical protein